MEDLVILGGRRQTMAHTEYAAVDVLFRLEEALKNYNEWIARKFASLIELTGDRSLDFGCGAGTLIKLVGNKFDASPAGIEIDPLLRQHCISLNMDVRKSMADFQGCKFDLVFSSNVLEHIEDDIAALKEIRGLIDEEGRLALFLPAFPILWSSMDARVGHYRRYTQKSISNVLSQAGFRVERSFYCDSIGFLATMLYKVLPNSDGEPSARVLKIYDRCVFPISRILDKFLSRWCGKNIFIVAVLSDGVGREGGA